MQKSAGTGWGAEHLEGTEQVSFTLEDDEAVSFTEQEEAEAVFALSLLYLSARLPTPPQ